MTPWFTVERIDDATFALSEYRHWEETHSYLLLGRERALSGHRTGACCTMGRDALILGTFRSIYRKELP